MLNKLYSYFFNKANTLRLAISKKEGESPWRVKTFAALYLFAVEIMEDLLKLLILLFKNPYDSFQLFTKQETLPICEYSYSDHKRFKKKVQLFSAAGISSIVAIALILNIILSLVVPGQLPSYAKTVNGGWDDWSNSYLAGDPPGPATPAGSIAISPANSAEISGTGTASDLRLKSSSYTATDDGTFSTTGSATESGTEIDFNQRTIATGAYHTVGLKDDGTVVAVGRSSEGQLNTTVANGWTNIKAISAGAYHTVGLKADGTVVAVGRSSEGQLNTTVANGWTNIKAIAAGSSYTVGLKNDGTVVGVGNNDQGQINVSGWTNIKAIAAGGEGYLFTVGLKNDGTVVGVGSNSHGQLNTTVANGWTNIKAISAGGVHTVGLKNDGTVVGIGYSISNSSFSTWSGIKAIATYYSPGAVGLKNDGTVVSHRHDVSTWSGIKAIAGATASSDHAVGLKDDGTVVGVGSNASGQLNTTVANGWTNIKQPSFLSFGSGTLTSTAVIGVGTGTSVGLANDESIIDFNQMTIAAGDHTAGLKADGTVVAVGSNANGQLNVTGWTNIKAIAASYDTSAGLKADGTVVAVGAQAGYFTTGWTNIKAIAAGRFHAVGLKTDGTVVAEGRNVEGQLNVTGWTNIKAIATGGYHTVGLKADGTVVAVGSNSNGKLNVTGWTNIKAITAGDSYTVGLKTDGTVVAEGYNGFGQLNVGTWTGIMAISVASSGNHTVGLKADGTVVAVGRDVNGQLNVTGWTNIKAIAAGYEHTVGLKADGTVVAVGLNASGQLNVTGWTNIKQPTYGHQPSGTFESATIDLGGKAILGNLDFASTATQSSIGTWSQTSDTDFNAGTISSTVVSGGSVGLGVTYGGDGSSGERVYCSSATTFDGSTCTAGYNNASTYTLASGTYNFTNFKIQDGVTVNVSTGGTQMIIKATGNVKIGTGAVLNVNGGSGGTPTAGGAGAGGYIAGSGGTGNAACSATHGGYYGYGPGGQGSAFGGGNPGGGGGGGGHRGVGGAGSTFEGYLYSGGNTYGSLDTDVFGGGGGGGGNGCNSGSYGGGGGGGGGSIQLWGDSVVINSNGKITVNGGDGGLNSGQYSGAGGGGAGGRILISGRSITNNGSLEAKGANGKVGDQQKNSGGGGGGRIILRDSDGLVDGTNTTSVIGGTATSPATGGGNGSTSVITYNSYAYSGTYTSPVKPVGPGAGFGVMSWSSTLNGQSLAMKVRSCNDSACSGETSFDSLSAVTSGNDITNPSNGVNDSDGYVQYQASFTSDTTATPTLNSVSININPLGIQVATSDSSSGPWTYYGPGESTSTYFTTTGTAIPSNLSGKQYFRYKAYLATADTAYTPTLDSATLNYTQYPSSSTVTNLKFNSGYTGLIWTSVSWAISNPSDISSSVKVKTQARVAANDTALGSATFAGYDGTNTNDSTYFDFYGSGQTNCSSAEGKFGDGDATKKTYTCQINQSDTTYLNKADPDRTWLELKLVLESDNYRAPQIDAARATFAINNEPEICVKLTDDTTCDTSVTTLKKIVEPSPFSYLSVAQDQSDQYGNVIFDSYLRDPDTNTGAVENQGFLYVGIEYTDSSGAFGNATDSVIPPVSPATGYYDGTGAAGKGRFATGANITITPKESGFANCELTGWTDYRAGFRYKCPVYTSTPNKYARYTFKWKIGRYDENGTFSGDVQDLALANNFKIRLVTYDGEGANSVNGSARAVSNGFTVDTKKPAVTVNSTIINAAPAASGSGTIGWLPSATDDNTMQYKLSDDGATWPASWSNYSATILHDFAESTDRTTTLYYRLKDAYGNETAPASVTSLQRPHNLTLIDVSNVKGEDTSKYSYANFISWNLVENPLNKFNSYIVYRCIRTNTDTANYCDEKTNYSIINSGQNTALSTNSFTDYLSSADTEKLVYYRVASKDNNGNISGWLAGGTTTSSVYGQANGRLDYGEGGGGGDGEPPKILVAPSFSNIAQTSANVIWTTDELATGGVFYSKNSTNYNSEKSTLAYQTTGYDATTSPSGRTIALTGLDASSIYNIRLKSVDASGNITICDAVTTASQATDSVTGAVTYINQTGYCPSGATADTYRFTTLEKDVTPPVISAVTISEVDHESAKIVWTTNENSDSCVSFDTADTDRTYGSGQCASGQITSHTVTLAGLTASMTYYVKVKSQDVEKNLADKCSLEDNTDCPTITLANANYAFTTTAAPPPEVVVISSGGGGGARGKQDFTAPVISGITVADITDQSATVAWTTDEKSSSFVQYGESENLLNTTGGQLDEVLSHKVVLKGLKPETKYFFKATSVDWAGNIGSSNILNFATEKAPTVEEEISQISGIEAQEKTKEVLEKLEEQIKAQKENIVDPLQTLLDALSPFVNEPIIIGESPEIEVNSTTATIKWRTDKKSTSFVALAREDEFDDKAAEPYKMVVGNPEDSVKEHKVEITGLLPATKYHYQVRSKALIGEMSKSKDFTFTTKSELPQIVSFLQKKTDNEKTAVIYWETSVPTDSVVKYTPYVEGKLDAKQSQIQGKPDMATSHEITLTNLDPGTIYQIEVSGKDPFANATAKTLPDFTTAIDKDAPVISQVRIESAMISGKTPKIQTIVSFRTDEPATSQVSFVEGGQEKFKQLPANLALSTTHTFVITDFKPASIYRIRVEATDESGNLAVSRDFTILTPAQSQSIIDIIVKTFENTFGWVKNVRF